MTARICTFVLVIWIGLGAAVPTQAQELSLTDSLFLMRADSALAEGRYGPAISMYRSFITRNPDAYWGRYGIARAFYYRGEPDRALPFLTELVHDYPEEADPCVTRGYANLQLGRIDPSAEDFLWVTNRFPEYTDAWVGLGVAYERSGQMRRAAGVYDR